MSLWVRMLAVMLVLSTGGAFQVVEAALDSVEDCGDEEESCDCATCLLTCVCCPARVACPPVTASVPARTIVADAVFAQLDEPVASNCAADIFQPPRA